VENTSDPLFAFILLLALPVFFIFLGANSIWDANEAFYVETPKQMLATGDYVNPSFNGQPRFNKPVLSYWVVAAFYQTFGETVAVERLAIALGAMGILAATFMLGRALGSPRTGVLAALLVATAPRVVFFSRRIFIDVYITMFMALALACFALAEARPHQRKRYLLLMYAAIGLGVLTKGPMAVVLPAAVIAAWLLWERRLRDVTRLMILPGALVVIAINAPWWGAVYLDSGWTHVIGFFVGENLGRFTSAITTYRDPWFFLPVLFADILLPWAPLLVVPLLIGRRRRISGHEDAAGPIRRLLWLWIVVIVVGFSFSASKEDLYIFPVMPAAAALIADSLISTGFGARHRGINGLLVAIVLGCVLLSGIVVWLFGSGYYAIASVTVAAAILAATGLSAAALIWRGRQAFAVAVIAGGFVLLNYLLVARVLPAMETLKPVPALAATITARASANAQVGFCNVVLPSLVYYLGRPVTELDCPQPPGGTPVVQHAVEFARQYPEVWILTSEPEWNELRARVPGMCVAARRPLFSARLGDLLTRRPPEDVLLVTTKCQ